MSGLSLNNNIIRVKIDDETIKFDNSGNLAIKTVDTAQLASGAVTSDKIADDNVTYDKIQDITASNSVLGNTGTGTVAERALVGDILLDEDDMTSDSAIKGATQQSIKAYVDINFNTVFNIIKDKKEINNGNSMTVRQFYEVPDLTAAITTKKSNATYKIDFSLSFCSNLFGYETAVKIMYKVNSGSYQDFQVPTNYGSRTPTQFSHYCGDGDARMNNISSTIFLDDATYNVGDVITFQPFVAGVRDSSGLKININASEVDTNDNEYSRGVSTLIVQEF